MKIVTANRVFTLHQHCLYRGYLQIAALDLTRSNAPALWLLHWNPIKPISTRPPSLRKNGTWYTYGHDLTKNVMELYKADGTIATAYDYTRYGSVTATGIDQPIQWSSEHYDPELALVYYNYRHYNPADGRWINRDPIAEEGGRNLYGFVGNASLKGIDILGMGTGEENPNPDNIPSLNEIINNAENLNPKKADEKFCAYPVFYTGSTTYLSWHTNTDNNYLSHAAVCSNGTTIGFYPKNKGGIKRETRKDIAVVYRCCKCTEENFKKLNETINNLLRKSDQGDDTYNGISWGIDGPNCATLGADLLYDVGMIAKPEWDKSTPVFSRLGRRLNGLYAPRPEELRNSVEKDCTLIYKNPQWKGTL